MGGGIAGLTAAVSLGRAGVQCEVVELQQESAGAAITIQNRAIHALQDLGLLDTLLEVGLPQAQKDVFRYIDVMGEIIPTPPMPQEPQDGLPSAVVVHRAALARLLQNAAEESGAVIHYGTTVTGVNDGDSSLTATFSDGRSGEFDLLVAADGVRSSVRSMVFGDVATPQYTGTTMFRWIVPGITDVGPTGFYQASNLIVMLRLRDGSLYLATGRNYDEPRRFTPEEARQVVRENLVEFNAPLTAALLERLDDSARIVVNDYNWLMLPDPWHRGRVLAIGDAAHATTAHLASGGGMAIEDAAVLGEEVSAGGELDEILQRFMTRRFERAQLVVNTSVEIGEMQTRGESVADQNALRGRALAALKVPY
ncbi:FAD-dependent oxidoreductase [Microbacterium sp. A196]|uniref:FAD-dependent oxidoreductase n=1 Tax=Microbacterium sp. A196 TaxID=3457320 RepID=UPI003FCF3E6F